MLKKNGPRIMFVLLPFALGWPVPLHNKIAGSSQQFMQCDGLPTRMDSTAAHSYLSDSTAGILCVGRAQLKIIFLYRLQWSSNIEYLINQN